MRPVFHWNLGSRALELGRRTLIMGVINVTPDSFSDGGLYLDPENALARGAQLLAEGASLLDVGGESTRPGSRVAAEAGAAPNDSAAARVRTPVSEEEELKRVIPVIRGLKRRHPEAIISVDTYKAAVARAAVEAGAEIVNDISGFRWDPQMPRTLAELKVGAVLMHTRGRPEEWRSLPPIGDAVLLVKRELRQWAEAAILAGIKRDRLVLDPGFGFGKNFEENYPLLARFGELQQMGFPLLAGTSRKSFVGRMLARKPGAAADPLLVREGANGNDAPVGERLYGTLATETALILKGVHVIRTHDVRAAVEAARVADTIVASGG